MTRYTGAVSVGRKASPDEIGYEPRGIASLGSPVPVSDDHVCWLHVASPSTKLYHAKSVVAGEPVPY